MGPRGAELSRRGCAMVTIEGLGWPFRAGPTEARGLGLVPYTLANDRMQVALGWGRGHNLGQAAFFGQMQF